jgi:hypothetical protein
MLTPATRITSTRELLGAVPTLIGFRPTQSLVLLGFMQSTSRLGPTLFRCLTPAGDRAAGPPPDSSDDLNHDPLVPEMVGRGTPLATGTRKEVLTCLTPQPDAQRATRTRAVRTAA